MYAQAQDLAAPPAIAEAGHGTAAGDALLRLAERIASLPGMIEQRWAACDGQPSWQFYLDSEFLADAECPVPFVTINAAGEILIRPDAARATDVGQRLRAPRSIAGLPRLWRVILNTYFAVTRPRLNSAWNVTQLHDRRHGMSLRPIMESPTQEVALEA